MPSPVNGASTHPLLESHENRLEHLEALANTMVEQLAFNTSKIENLGLKVDACLTQFSQQLADSTAHLSAQLITMVNTTCTTEKRLDKIENRHDKENELAQVRIDRRKIWKGAIWALFWTAIGVGVKEGLTLIFAVIH